MLPAWMNSERPVVPIALVAEMSTLVPRTSRLLTDWLTAPAEVKVICVVAALPRLPPREISPALVCSEIVPPVTLPVVVRAPPLIRLNVPTALEALRVRASNSLRYASDPGLPQGCRT